MRCVVSLDCWLGDLVMIIVSYCSLDRRLYVMIMRLDVIEKYFFRSSRSVI